MFSSSRSFLLFDYFRVPYAVVPGLAADPWPERHPLSKAGRLQLASAEGGTLSWPVFDSCTASTVGGLRSGSYWLDCIPIHGRVVPDLTMGQWAAALGGEWRRQAPVRDRRGHTVSSVWSDNSGNVLLPFDPDEAIKSFWSEKYRQTQTRSRLRQLVVRSYYRVRPVMPRATQLRLRRLYTRVQSRSQFPRWPVETALHDLYAFLFRQVADVARRPVPRIAPWPSGATWALVLTHDVETELGYRQMGVLRNTEIAQGFRSSWNFVPMRYRVDDGVVRELTDDGFEVGVHGLYHDGRDLESEHMLSMRLPHIRTYARRWGATGFRSPATHRRWEWMPRLGFEYDSSYPDTDPFEPQPGGCCSWWPYFNEDLVELPITLPQDHTLFAILGKSDERMWVDKTHQIRDAGGMSLLITHPDYMLDARYVSAYRRFLNTFSTDPSVWRALPRDVSTWWRQRAGSRLVQRHQRWEIEGPAADEGRVEFAGAEVGKDGR